MAPTSRGKEGGFELSAMARKFPEITAGARSLKMEGLDSVAQLTAALQVSMKSAGSEDAAATNLSNFLGKLTSPETVRNFEKFGISVERELKKAAERGVSPMEHMLQVIDQVTGGDAIRMGQLFGDKQVLDFLRAMIPNMEEYRRIKEASLSADGVVDKDLAELMDTFNESKKQLGESIGNLFTLPPEVMEALTDLFVKADAIVEKMILWKKEHPQLTKYLFLGATAVGAMAVAGGALLTASAGLIGTMAVLRFGMTGLGARAAFAAGDLIGVGSAFRGLTRLPRFALSKLLAPVRWTARLVSKLPWARLVGRLLLSSLIIPLRWTAALLPGFAPALARFTGFRRDASAEISKLSKHVDRESASMRRSLSGIRWGRLFKFAGLAGVAYTALQPTELGDGTVTDDVRNTNPDKIRESQIRGMYVVPNDLPDQQKNAAEVVQGVRRNGDLPTEAARDGLRGSVASIQSDIARMRAEIDKLGASPADVAMASSLQQTIQAREVELQKVRQELAAAETLAGDLTSALQLLNGTSTAPEINTESIDRAIDKIIELTSRMEVLPYAGTGPRPIPKPAIPPLAGARASGGPVYANAPYLVNENTPRSEVFVPSQSGGILNVSQAQMALRSYLMTAAPSRPAKRSADLARLNRGAQGLRAASLAVLTSSALAAPVAAQPAQSVKQGLGAVTVQIENFTVQVPSGVSDPQAIADLVADQIGQRVAATVSASFSD